MAIQSGKIAPTERLKPRIQKIELETLARVQFKDITNDIQKLVASSGVQDGLCQIFVMHTTAAILINENDDPAFTKDLENFLARLAPPDHAYHHNDGNCDAHLKASILGGTKSVLVEKGRLVLGRWQGIYLCEFDGPRRRGLRIKVISD